MFWLNKRKRNYFCFVLGFEQSNDFLTSELFKATNRHEGEIDVDENDEEHSTDNYIVQLLLRFLRMEHIEEEEDEEEEEEE